METGTQAKTQMQMEVKLLSAQALEAKQQAELTLAEANLRKTEIHLAQLNECPCPDQFISLFQLNGAPVNQTSNQTLSAKPVPVVKGKNVTYFKNGNHSSHSQVKDFDKDF